jgi:hypothetical protein
MKIAFTFSHLDNYALNESRKWEFMNCLRVYLGIEDGQKLDSFDALDMIGKGDLPYFVDEDGCKFIILSKNTVECSNANEMFCEELVIHALRTFNSRVNLLTSLRALKTNPGAVGLKQVKILAKHFKEMLDRTEW